MPFCTYCGQSFTRDEHLERHILTHTNVKPYKCFTCHMSFARRDLLHRHYTVHGKDSNQDPLPASNGIVPKSAGRTPIACSNCAKTKTKCDKKFPCTRCASRNLKCTVRPTRRMTKNAMRIAAEGELVPGAVADPAMMMMAPNQMQNMIVTPLTIVPPPPGMALSPCGSNHSHSHHGSQAGTPVKEDPCGHNTPPAMISPHDTPVGSFHNTPTSGFGEFMRPTSSHNGVDTSSPPSFMPVDWSQMQMAMGDQMQMGTDMMTPGMAFSPNAFMDGSMMEPMAFMSPTGMPTGYPFPNLHTPLATPGLEQLDSCFPTMLPLGMEHTAPLDSPPSSLSIPSDSDIDSNPACLDAWSAFRCNPAIPSQNCPKTAKINLERLEQTLKSHENWTNWKPIYDEADFALGDNLAVTPLQEMPRDKLLAITQSFLHKALDVHRNEPGFPPSGLNTPPAFGSGFVILPPARVLECFLRSYANGFERYFPMTSKGMLNANELLGGYNDRASSLLVLLMMAQGAMLTPSVDARWLTAGLTEACRLSLFNLVESNISMSSDPQVLHAALLFIVQAAWSGDKWQMDIAMGQRGVYFAMLRHSGLLEGQQPNNSAARRDSVDGLWNDWVQAESRSRLIYSWAMVDQDLSLFHDTAPLFSVTEFNEPMPDSDALWHAKSATEWSSIFEQVHAFADGNSSLGSGVRPLSLRDLFRHFLDDTLVAQGIELTPLQLRLLLHPLQSLVCQFRQLLSCFGDSTSMGGSQAFTAASARLRLEEVQALLQRWYSLADRYMKANPLCPLMQASLVIFHLISLNAVTNFPEIEKLARREEVDGSYQQLVWLHKRAISDVEEAIFHCGQVVRHIRAMPRSIRPSWWAGAIYRVALILWTDSLVHNEALTPTSINGAFPNGEPTNFAIDALTPDHPSVVRYLTKREGTPMVTKRDGSLMPIDNSFGVLFHCVDVVGEGVSTRFADGIRNKLERLAKGGR